jgi:hypothetical protein
VGVFAEKLLMNKYMMQMDNMLAGLTKGGFSLLKLAESLENFMTKSEWGLKRIGLTQSKGREPRDHPVLLQNVLTEVGKAEVVGLIQTFKSVVSLLQ